MEGKTDRRVKYTKMMIRDALVGLMQNQHISGISIKSICDIADVNRSTFYAHYKDQYDLLRQIEQEVYNKLKLYLEKQDYIDNQPVSAQVLSRILEYAKENAELFKALLSENCDFAFQKDVVQLAQIITSQQNLPLNLRQQDYLQTFAITACINVFYKWLQDGTIETPTEMSEFILEILYHGIHGLQHGGQKQRSN